MSIKVHFLSFLAEECPEVEYLDGVALFSGGYLDASNVEVSSTRSNFYHGADRLPLIDPANNPLAWCAAGTTAGEEYVSINLGDPLYVFGIVLRGNNHEDFPAWVESVRLEYVDKYGITQGIEGVSIMIVKPLSAMKRQTRGGFVFKWWRKAYIYASHFCIL